MNDLVKVFDLSGAQALYNNFTHTIFIDIQIVFCSKEVFDLLVIDLKVAQFDNAGLFGHKFFEAVVDNSILIIRATICISIP